MLNLPPLLPVPLGAAEILGIQSNPRQVMSPNSSPNLPQDPFRLQRPKPEAYANVRTESGHPKCKEDDASCASVSVKVQQEVKEEFESISEGSRAPLPAQSSQESFCESGRPYERRNSRQIDEEAADVAVP